jgi:hypothetical protein
MCFRRLTIIPLLSIFLISSVFIPDAAGQPVLNFRRVVMNWPAVELYFSVGCNGQQTWNMSPSNFRVYDADVEVTNFILECPDVTLQCPMSTALVFDASGSMAGTGNLGAIQAGRTFVTQMDGIADEAAVLWYNSNVTLRQGMTSSKSLLNVAIDSIPATGMTAVWDGIYAGLQEVSANGSNSCRAVVALTDGGDNSSSKTVAEIVHYANMHHIRVFTVGLGSSINGTELDLIAQLTGGRYYQTADASQLSVIYDEIATIIHQGFNECRIVYDVSCADGAFHDVDLQLFGFCGGADTKTKTYRAPLDSTTFITLPLTFGDVATTGDADFEMPLYLSTTLSGVLLRPLTIDVCFNAHVLGYRNAEIRPGTLLDGLDLTVTPIACGMRLRTQDSKVITGTGELLRVKFHTNVSPNDTAFTNVTAGFASLESGCLQPVVAPGTVTIIPGSPTLSCVMEAPRRITWDTLQASYSPSPFQAKLTVYNSGNTTATGGSCEIALDTTDLRIMSPMSSTVNLPDIPPGEFREAIWLLDALPRIVADSSDITITARFANHADVNCMIRTFIGKSEPVLACEIDIPQLRADTAVMRYDPNPFPVSVTVRNIGIVPADNIQVFIEYAPEMALGGVDVAGPWVKPTDPASLQPGQSGTVSWQVYHPLLRFTHTDTLRFRVRADRGGTRICETVLDIPPINGPILTPRCYVPDSLHYEEAFGVYIPNPFTVRLSVVNQGTDTAYAVSGRLLLPDGLELDPPTQSLIKPMHTAPMGPWHIGDPVPEVSWTVRWTKLESSERNPELRFLVSGLTRHGDTLEPVPTSCSIRIPGLRRELYCNLEMVDSLRVDVSGKGLEPNPVTISYILRNTGQMNIRLARVYLSLPVDGILLNPASPQVLNTAIDTLLRPGDSIRFVWTVDVQSRSYARTALFAATVIESQGDPHNCDARLFIPSVTGEVECTLQSPDIMADNASQSYTPMPFPLNINAISNKAALTDSVYVRIELPAGSLALYGPDAGVFTKALLPARLFPQQQGGQQWLLEHPVTRSEVRYTVRVLVWEAGGDSSICETEIVIPAIPAPFWFDLAASGPLSFCDGGEVTLDAGPGFASYLWSTQDTTRTIVVRRSGSYSCSVIAPDGVPGLSNSVTVTVYPLPPKPMITRTGDVLTAPAAMAWQWYREGAEILNSTAQTHAAVETGNYTVRITDNNGCEALSDPIAVNTLPVDEGQAVRQRFHIYPNPAEGMFSVDVELETSAVAVITLHDLLGRELRRIARDEVRQSFTERIDLRELHPGLYILRLSAGSQSQTRMLIVN